MHFFLLVRVNWYNIPLKLLKFIEDLVLNVIEVQRQLARWILCDFKSNGLSWELYSYLDQGNQFWLGSGMILVWHDAHVELVEAWKWLELVHWGTHWSSYRRCCLLSWLGLLHFHLICRIWRGRYRFFWSIGHDTRCIHCLLRHHLSRL